MQDKHIDEAPYEPSLEHRVHLLACAILGLDDEDHEDDEEAAPLEKAILKLITTEQLAILERLENKLSASTPYITSKDGEVCVRLSGIRSAIQAEIDKIGGSK